MHLLIYVDSCVTTCTLLSKHADTDMATLTHAGITLTLHVLYTGGHLKWPCENR